MNFILLLAKLCLNANIKHKMYSFKDSNLRFILSNTDNLGCFHLNKMKNNLKMLFPLVHQGILEQNFYKG